MASKTTPGMINGAGRRKLASLTVSYDKLAELLAYDPLTGTFTWKVSISRAIKAGTVAGTISAHGYVRIGISGTQYYAHKIAWLFIYREWPDQLDHIDRDRSNNAINNLRKATNSQNQGNRSVDNVTGYKGVTKRGNRYIAQITINYVNTYLGSFGTPEEASKAYQEAAKAHFGEFAHG